ncbi:SprT-like domain-containing protein [Aegicerativicinus sediminis]|uniref:SprT-like domain-containing protein n=1 Tax=Aegicerativicinus sediminis TaxID=2893202 RepID=UPI001E30A662|nr:SprT-like domain-containing protein [Aegicerativicinus sediminis]
MKEGLSKYLPTNSVEMVLELLNHDRLELKIKNERRTRHGDYRRLPNGKHQISINNSLNPYRFLITLIHEIAHFEAYSKYGRQIKPHGIEWKHTFKILMLPFINPDIFPEELLPMLAKHFKNPKATSDTDVKLALALKQFDAPNDKSFIFDVPYGQTFRLYNGKVFKKGNIRRKRYECIELRTGRTYLFNPNAEVEILES